MDDITESTSTLSTAQSIVEDIVWATASTVSPNGVPRSRLVHPVWYWPAGGPVGYVASRPTPLRVAHIEAHPTMALFYWSPKHDTVAIDATAEWVPDDDLLDVWDEIAATPAPMGFDPYTIWPGGPTSHDYGVLRLVAYRVTARRGVDKLATWRRSDAALLVSAGQSERPLRIGD